MKSLNLSEVAGALKAGISRITWRSVTCGSKVVKVDSLLAVANALELDVTILGNSRATSANFAADCSTIGVSYLVLRDGNSSWKIHYMNLVDEFRRTLDPRLILLPPPAELSVDLKAMLAGIVQSLCDELAIDSPPWSLRRYDLEKPWFVSETESLKASAILESPLAFRRNQIFVGSNFLQRM